MKRFLSGHVKAVDGDDPNGSFEVVLSAPTVDRDGEVIDGRAFEPLPEWINFDADHGMSVQSTVGSGQPFYDGDLLKVRGTYASTALAQEVRTLVTEGHIRQTSVAFIDAEREVKDGIPHVVKAELLNGAFVAVPSNRQALVLAAKQYDRPVPGLKAVAGSYEALREDLTEAIRAANPQSWWVYVIATFDDAVIYELEGSEGPSRFRSEYTIGDEGLTLSAGEPVEISEIVEPAKSLTDGLIARIKTGARNSTGDLGRLQQIHDLSVENGAECKAADDDKTVTTDPEGKAAAPAAADPPADVLVAQARAQLAALEADLLLLD